MQLYALEALAIIFVMIGLALLYRFLVNSPTLQKFVENSKPSLTTEELEARIEQDVELASRTVREEEATIQKKTRRVQRVKKLIGEE